MKKKQRNIYLLLTAVLIVWGLIGYKIFNSLDTSLPAQKMALQQENFIPITIDSVKKFSIKANYRDPFLGVVRKKIRIIKKTKPKLKEVIRFPKIEFVGFISGSNNSKFIVKINNQTFFYNLLDVNKEVKLLSGSKNEITVSYKTEQKTYEIKI